MSRLQKAPAASPVLSLAGVPSTPVWAADPATQQRAEAAYEAAGVPGERPAPEPPRERKEKVGGFYAYRADLDRIRAAWANTQLCEDGHRSLSDFLLAAALAEAQRLEAAHHDGQPWPPLPAGKVRSGRPAGS